MIAEYLTNRINDLSQYADIVVLKGFDTTLVAKMGQQFVWLDDYVFEENRINLDKVNAQQLLQKLFIPYTGTAILTYESFLDMTTLLRNLSICQKRFRVLTNNLLSSYENPSLTDIPDFDSIELQSDPAYASSFARFYSYCEHIDGKQYVQYIGYFLDDPNEVKEEPFLRPTPLRTTAGQPPKSSQSLSSQNKSANRVLSMIYHEQKGIPTIFIVEKQNTNDNQLRVLQSASVLFSLNLTFYECETNLHTEIRQGLYTLLKDIWGYSEFRSLKMYEDLNVNRNIAQLSQGEIIEAVVQQAEKGLKGEDEMHNVLLTSPTGAGKSLLFQLAAIYLAETYQALTIVVSPLVALMNDQVENLAGNYKRVATLNGNIPPSQKEDILEKVRNGEIHILYLAPELLLSYSITSFIGKRRIGLFVVDEAHTVTTWGRDFRVDYWFLGDYLRQAKRILEYNFPIFALTATAVWDTTGKNDMVFDTIRSLYMDPCIKFIGVVRRDDIHFDINLSGINKSYNQNRADLTIQRIHESIAHNCKTIVYFPYKSTIRSILKNEKMDDCLDRVSEYHASLNPNEKTLNATDFKTGKRIVMCATKAYGMGIDVSDIQMVYHHAPTGCLSDYVQEIGRVARDPNITGIAKIDFSTDDFRYTRTLHGLSAIKSYQLLEVLRKLMALFKMNGEKRNMLISTSDFEYIFPGKDVDYDQKVKSCLLLISHDLLNKLGFNAIIVRPKNLFSKAYVKITKAQEAKFVRIYNKFITPMNEEGVYMLDADQLWNKHYSQYSFPNFKFKLADGSIFKDFNISWLSRINLVLNEDSVAETRAKLVEFFSLAEKVLHKMALEHKRTKFSEIKAMLPPYYTQVAKEAFVATFKQVYASEAEQGDEVSRYCTIFPEYESIQLIKHGYEKTKLIYLQTFDRHIHSVQQLFYCSPFDRLVNLCELMNSLNLSDYQRSGGENPSIFIRINNPAYLKNLIRIGRYSNHILNEIYDKFEYSEKIYEHFFTTRMTDKQRWDFIEAYFLGANEEELFAIGKQETNAQIEVTESKKPQVTNSVPQPQDYKFFQYLDRTGQQFWIENYATIPSTRDLLKKLRKIFPSSFSSGLRKYTEACPDGKLYDIVDS
jgi:superfamily II DNA helicase RecQ